MKKRHMVTKLMAALAIMLVIFAVPVEAAGTINKKSLTLYTGKTYSLKVLGVRGKVKWNTSKKAVATVSNKGKVTARKAGRAKITAKVGSEKFSCTVTVKSPSISKKNLKLTLGKSYKLKINGTNKNVKWLSSDRNVATVSSKGVVKAKTVGFAKITAIVDGKKYICKVHVPIPGIPSEPVPLDYVGGWSDNRCGMTIDLQNDIFYSIEIHWANDAMSGSEWSFIARYDKSQDCLVYENGTRIDYAYPDNGHEQRTVVYSNGKGNIYLKNGRLYWKDKTEGAGDTCVFTRQ